LKGKLLVLWPPTMIALTNWLSRQFILYTRAQYACEGSQTCTIWAWTRTKNVCLVGSEVPTELAINRRTIFLNLTSCSQVEVHWHRLTLPLRILPACLHALSFNPEDRTSAFLRKSNNLSWNYLDTHHRRKCYQYKSNFLKITLPNSETLNLQTTSLSFSDAKQSDSFYLCLRAQFLWY
jgi:hypothetical protein